MNVCPAIHFFVERRHAAQCLTIAFDLLQLGVTKLWLLWLVLFLAILWIYPPRLRVSERDLPDIMGVTAYDTVHVTDLVPSLRQVRGFP